MSSLRTFFRAVVMLAALGLLAKAWLHFGLTLGEVQAIGSRGCQAASEMWTKYWDTPGADAPLAADHSATYDAPPAAFVPPGGSLEPTRLPAATLQPDNRPAVQLVGSESLDSTPAWATPADAVAAPRLLPSQDVTPVPLPRANDRARAADPLATLQERIDGLGARDQQLTPWGSGGQFVRFTCSVPWNDTPNFTRQFEAVAETPLEAAQRVAAEIEAWRAAK